MFIPYKLAYTKTGVGPLPADPFHRRKLARALKDIDVFAERVYL
jgi:hypothetical protein